MRIAYHYSAPYPEYRQVIPLLESASIPYELDELRDPPKWFVFDITNDSRIWERVKKELDVSYPGTKAPSCISQMLFDESELSGSPWLTVRSKFDRADPVCLEMTIEQKCCYITQKGDYRFSGHIEWGKNHFMSPFGGTLFTDDFGMNILTKEKMLGIEYRPAKKKSTDEILPNIHQIVAKNILPNNTMIIKPGDCQTAWSCIHCRRERYILDQLYIVKLRKDELERERSDIFMTEELFGIFNGAPVWIVSQRFYQVLKAHQMTRSLVFEPVDLVD